MSYTIQSRRESSDKVNRSARNRCLGRRHLAILLAVVLLPHTADARVLRGEISYRGAPAVGADVTICGAMVTTNNSGRFRVDVADGTSGCSIVVDFRGRQSNAQQISLRSYLFLSLKAAEGKWVIEVR